jgi:hypothetical protein
MADTREWVRNHRSAGYIAGRFPGEYEGEPRDMLIVQTTKGVVLVPAGSTLPISKQDIISQTALDLGPVIDSILEGGLSLSEVEEAWQLAIERKQRAATRMQEAQKPALSAE